MRVLDGFVELVLDVEIAEDGEGEGRVGQDEDEHVQQVPGASQVGPPDRTDLQKLVDGKLGDKKHKDTLARQDRVVLPRDVADELQGQQAIRRDDPARGWELDDEAADVEEVDGISDLYLCKREKKNEAENASKEKKRRGKEKRKSEKEGAIKIPRTGGSPAR